MPKWAKVLIGLIIIAIIVTIGFLFYVNTAFVSKDDVKEELADHINVEEDDLYFENIDLEMDKNQYEVDFYYNNNEYEAKVDAKEGKIIYTDFPMNNNLNNTKKENETTTKEEEITLDKAKEIALDHAKLNKNNVTLTKAKEEFEDGIMIYEIEYKDTTYEYDFDISKTGEIIHYDKDRIHD